ncbi:MAG: hypothetical protein I3273_02805 [Candidatus Moeniiplasma glomeromycotorum]|nr:hypothetical protein [Candidatus Moeniiplasma glomeromycotorum]MCE8167615.1 hypothetical protein [Candidatus Moeniiplasma glomeromycotorum]MCE8169035.1 hypothetical protein [Candidatus Moeniiplasma glomeromycotorum]
MINKRNKYPNCDKSSSVWEETFKKMEKNLRSDKSIHAEKISLFNCLKGIESGKLETSEEKSFNCLLQSKLYAELAKDKMKEYKKLTMENYSK